MKSNWAAMLACPYSRPARTGPRRSVSDLQADGRIKNLCGRLDDMLQEAFVQQLECPRSRRRGWLWRRVWRRLLRGRAGLQRNGPDRGTRSGMHGQRTDFRILRPRAFYDNNFSYGLRGSHCAPNVTAAPAAPLSAPG